MMKKAIILGLLAIGSAAQAKTYELTITNGAGMPISPGVIYASTSNVAESRIGANSEPGFVKLCQTGMNDDRANELVPNAAIKAVAKTAGPVLPGESMTFTLDVNDKAVQGIHFEAMYGKSKDACAVVSVGRHSLVALAQHVSASVEGKDQVVLSGAFTDPSVGQGCGSAANGVECLRALSTNKSGSTQVRAFSGYLPSVLDYIEKAYGAEDAQSLLIPTGGAVQFRLVEKH